MNGTLSLNLLIRYSFILFPSSSLSKFVSSSAPLSLFTELSTMPILKKIVKSRKKQQQKMSLSFKVEYFSDIINICHTKQVFVFDVVHIIVFNHLCLMIFSLFRLFLFRRIKSLWFHVIFIILLNSNQTFNNFLFIKNIMTLSLKS